MLNRSNSIFGLQENTLDSILFSILPPVSHTYKETPEPPPRCAGVDTKPDAQTDFLMLVLDTLRKNGGFRMPEVRRRDGEEEGVGTVSYDWCSVSSVPVVTLHLIKKSCWLMLAMISQIGKMSLKLFCPVCVRCTVGRRMVPWLWPTSSDLCSSDGWPSTCVLVCYSW